MKKKIGVLFACMLTAAMVALTGCGSGDTTVTTAEFSAEEAAVANAITDVSARFAMPADFVLPARFAMPAGFALSARLRLARCLHFSIEPCEIKNINKCQLE